MNLLHELPLRNQDGHLHAVVEVPKGSSVKLKYEESSGLFLWSRALPLGTRFPYDFGFLPQTIGGDGDALDVLVLADVASYPGVVVPARAIGALRVEQMRPGQPVKRNDRILLVPINGHRRRHINDVAHVAQRVLDEIEAFFSASLALTGKNVRFCGWASASEAETIIQDGHAHYQKQLTGAKATP